MKINLSILFILSLTVGIHTSEVPYSIRSLNSSSGIFYNNLGLAKISTDYHTLLSFTNISFLHIKLSFIKTMYSKSKDLCDHATQSVAHSFHCTESLKSADNQIIRLEEKLETISHLTGHNFESRQKRGLFDGVSYAFKWLFGVPDADDAVYYTNAINSLVHKNRETQLLLKQQVSILSSSITDYNKSAEILKYNEEKLNQNIAIFNNFSEDTTNRLTVLSQSELVVDHLNLLSDYMFVSNEECDILISTILFSKQNIIHPSIITPRQLRNELLKVKLTNNEEFPIPLTDYNSIHKYFSISTLSIIYNNDILVYALKIPLVQEQVYNLYNLIPTPISFNNSNVYSYINPSYPYLLISTTKMHYSRVKDLSSCKKLTSVEYICKDIVIQLTTEQPVCEVLLKSKFVKTIPLDCSTKTIKANLELWHPLSENSWLYITTTPTTGTLTCDKSQIEVLDVPFQGTGIFTMAPKCKCYTTSSILYATTNLTHNFTNTNFIPDININIDNCCVKKTEIINSYNMDPIQLKNINLDALRHTQHKLSDFDKIIQRNLEEEDLKKESNYFNYFIGGVATLIIMISLYCCCCKCCDCRSLPIIGKWFPPPGKSIITYCINSNNTMTNSQLISMRLSQLQEAEESEESNTEFLPTAPYQDGFTELDNKNLMKMRRSATPEKKFKL